jgi:hypothetical protein
MSAAFHQAEVEFHREVFKIRPVTLHCLPAWFARRVCWAAGTGRGRNAAVKGLCELDNRLPIRLLDHWGQSVDEQGQTVFVTEPYLSANDPHVHAAAAALACQLGIEFRVLPPWQSWWFPGQTIRLEFRECPHDPICAGCLTREQLRDAGRERRRRERQAARYGVRVSRR